MIRPLLALVFLATLGCEEAPLDPALPMDAGARDSARPMPDSGRPMIDASSPPSPDAGAPPDAGPPPPPDAGPDDPLRLTEGPCVVVPGDISITQFAPAGPDRTLNPATHPDINPALRGWLDVPAALEWVRYDDPAPDCLLPHFDGLFTPGRLPRFTRTLGIYSWNWEAMTPGPPEMGGESNVKTVDVETTPGEVLRIPITGREIAAGGVGALVLYVADNAVTLKFTAEDNIIYGYALHLYGVCVDPRLRQRYDELHAAGRNELPAMHMGSAFARARGNRMRIVIRDTGSFMDPRAMGWWGGEYENCPRRR